MAGPLVALRDVRVQRDAATLLDLPDFEVHEREIVAVVGANGAGKSTLLRVIGLLERPSAGTVYFRGVPATAQNSLVLRRRMASVLQAPLLLDATVYANAALGLKLRGVTRREIDMRLKPWLERLGIDHLAARPAQNLSGGEARRASLARALVLDPELLLLDEPFSALDAPSRESLLLDLPEILAQTAATVIMVTHDMQEAASLGRRIGVLSHGRLIQFAAAEEIFTSPANEEVAAIAGMQNRIPGIVERVTPGTAVISFAGGAAEVAGEYTVGARVTLWIRAEEIALMRTCESIAREVLSFRAKVRRVSPWISQYRVVLQADCGWMVALIDKSRFLAHGLREGDDVLACFAPAAVCVIRADGQC